MLTFLLAIIVWTNFKSNSIKNIEDARIYRWNTYHKLFFAFVFAIYYIVIFEGGDTSAYWHTMGVLENLLFHSPSDFWEVITNEPTRERFYGNFSYETGYPLRFIYMEPESFFVAKALLPIRLITFDSYLATSFVLAFFMADASWKIYTLAKQVAIFNQELLMLFVLFLPSVAFWSSGLSKDTIVFISLMNIVYYLNQSLRSAFKLKNWLLLLFFTYLILFIRPFILYAMLVPLTLMLVIGLINKIKSFPLLKTVIKSVIIVSGIVGFILILRANINPIIETNQMLADAINIQQDFNQNKAVYGDQEGKRYSIGEIEVSAIGILKIIPASVFAGLYRPLLWEGLSPALFFNGLESMLFIFLTVWFFISKPGLRIKAIAQNEILMFSFVFILIIAFMTGFTSILFGVLVRLRAPLLPFFGLLLSIDWKLYLNKQLNETKSKHN